MVAIRIEDVASRARRVLLAGGLGLAMAAGLAACGNGGGGADDRVPGDTPAPSPTATATPQGAQPGLNAAEVRRLAKAALLSPDSPLLDGYEPTLEAASTIQAVFAPLQDCKQEEAVDGRRSTYSQVFEGPWPKIEISAHTYDGSSVEVLEQLREIWDSDCTTFEEIDTTSEPYRSERIETVAAPEGVDRAQWVADCAEVTILEDGTGGIVFCTAFVAVGEHVILDIELSGLLNEWEQYADLLGAIATEVLDAQE